MVSFAYVPETTPAEAKRRLSTMRRRWGMAMAGLALASGIAATLLAFHAAG